MHWYFLISSIILPLVSTCFLMQWYFLIFSYYLTVSNGCSLTALKSVEVTQHSGSFKWGSITYIFLLFDCFEWALIDRIEKRRGHSALWQFRMGGGVKRQIYPKSANFELTCRFMLCFTEGLFVLHRKDLINANTNAS